MLNPLHTDSVVATSESDSENELVSVSGQLPSQLAAQLPTDVETFSDIHIGPLPQCNSPVTVNQYIAVKGNDDVESLDENPDENTDKITPQPAEGANPEDNGSVAIKFLLEIEKEDIDVYEGHRSVQWVVNVTASSQPKLVWYGPNCKILEERDGSMRFEVHTSPSGTKLKLYNISLADRGMYRLQASKKEGEEWAYFTLNVKGKYSLDMQHVVVCHVAKWAHSRSSLGRFTVDDIEPTLCTHLVYASAFVNMARNAIESVSPEYDLEENNGRGAYRKLTSLKRDYPHLKVLLGVGDWTEKSARNYSKVAESPYRRKALITSASELLRKYNFDGLDLHWRNPAEQSGVSATKKNFVSLLKEASIDSLLYNGAARNKLVLGLPLFGRIFGVKITEGGVGFPKEFESLGMPGPYLKEPGFWGYNEICLEVDNPINNWKRYWDNVTHTAYASKDGQLISYDDARSLTDKVELAVHKELAGVAVYFLDMDDFRGNCNFGSSGSIGYPLMRAINNALDNPVYWKKTSLSFKIICKTANRLSTNFWCGYTYGLEKHSLPIVKCMQMNTPHLECTATLSPKLKQIEKLYLPTYLLTPCSRVLLGKLTGSVASQDIPAFYGTRKFITVITSAPQLSLF